MNLDLTSVRAKLARAQEHAQALDHELKFWIERKPYSLTEHVNPDSTRYSLVLRENERPPLQRWTLMAADCLNNLRSALDYLVYTIAVFESGINPPPDEGTLAFPITDCRANFDEAIRKGRLGKISEPVRAAVEGLQPYNRPHEGLPMPLLRILRVLNNTDKHRLLKVSYAAVAQGKFSFVGPHPDDGRKFRSVLNEGGGELKDGTEIVAMICDRPTPNMEWREINLTIVVAIWHGKAKPTAPEHTGHTELSALLELLSDEVRTVVHTFVK